MEELFGETAEKKEVRKIALSMKETGASKALHTVELLSSVLSFPHGVRTLLKSGLFYLLLFFVFVFVF